LLHFTPRPLLQALEGWLSKAIASDLPLDSLIQLLQPFDGYLAEVAANMLHHLPTDAR
jgi:hypothetical protein